MYGGRNVVGLHQLSIDLKWPFKWPFKLEGQREIPNKKSYQWPLMQQLGYYQRQWLAEHPSWSLGVPLFWTARILIFLKPEMKTINIIKNLPMIAAFPWNWAPSKDMHDWSLKMFKKIPKIKILTRSSNGRKWPPDRFFLLTCKCSLVAILVRDLPKRPGNKTQRRLYPFLQIATFFF